MESTESAVGRIAEKVSARRLELFTELIRRYAIEGGCPEADFDNALDAAMYEFKLKDAEEDILGSALKSYENRGMDTLGRIVIEYCFIRTPNEPMLRPEFSDEDSLARWHFSHGTLPRPLMRYFLVSVRGSIENLDQFSTESYLFETDPDRLEAARRIVNELIEAFKGPFGSGESSVDWQAVYEDQRFQQLALDVISDLIQKIEQDGLERYLDYLNRYRQLDAASDEGNLMQRPFTIRDAQQITEALQAAERVLQDKTM